jgi:hypothetical protein
MLFQFYPGEYFLSPPLFPSRLSFGSSLTVAGALFTHDTHLQDISRLWLCWAIRAKRTSVHLKFGGQRSSTERVRAWSRPIWSTWSLGSDGGTIAHRSATPSKPGPVEARCGDHRYGDSGDLGSALRVARRWRADSEFAKRYQSGGCTCSQVACVGESEVQATRRLATRRRTHGESCIDPDGRAASNASLEPRRTAALQGRMHEATRCARFCQLRSARRHQV